jgi:hypothetical protein
MEVCKIQILMQRGNLCLICGYVHVMLFCPYKGWCQKKKTLVAGRQAVGSDKVSLVTGLLIPRIRACSDVTFLPDTQVSANKMKAGETSSFVASRSV